MCADTCVLSKRNWTYSKGISVIFPNIVIETKNYFELNSASVVNIKQIFLQLTQ